VLPWAKQSIKYRYNVHLRWKSVFLIVARDLFSIVVGALSFKYGRVFKEPWCNIDFYKGNEV